MYPTDHEEFNSIRSKLFSLLEELHTSHFGRDVQIGLSVRGLLLSLNRMIWQRKNPRAKKERRSSYQLITDHIATHLGEDLSLDALSRDLYLSKYYIAHLVRENTGLSLHQYITKKRLSACIEAMQSGENIGVCCLQFGFQNYSGFYRAFIKEFACSPTVYMQERVSSAEAEEQIN